MSTLLVDELYPGIVFRQPFKIKRDIDISHIRPWVYKNGSLQDGTFECRVYDGGTLLAKATIDFATFNAGFTENYAHGHLRFDFNALSLRLPEGSTEKEYFIEYEMVGHTKDGANYVGIVRRWEDKTYPIYGDGVVDNEAPNDNVEPSGLELFEYKYI